MNIGRRLTTPYSIVLFLCMPMRTFVDTWLDIIDTNNYITYGLASLKPLLSIPDVIFRQFGISNLDSYYYTVDILNSTEDYFWVFDNKNYNAFVTLFLLLFRFLGDSIPRFCFMDVFAENIIAKLPETII